MNKFWRKFIFGEDETSGKIKIVTPNRGMKFESNFNTKQDFERALHLIKEEMEIMFDDVSSNLRSGRK